MIPEKEREALMRLTMCARLECSICIYEDKCNFDFQYETATRCMNILADALRKTENSSEKPNKSEIPTGSEPQTNKVVEKKPTPIRDFMVNGKTKDEPQHGYMWVCSNCGLDVHSDYGKCPRCGKLRDEPQTKMWDETQSDCDLWQKDRTCIGCYRYDICREAACNDDAQKEVSSE